MKIVTGIALCGVFCSASFFVDGDENTNAPVAIVSAPAPASATPPALVISLRAFIDDYLSRSQSGYDKNEIELYADQADYFGEGMQSRSYISNDIDKYNSRWPQRHMDINGLPTLKYLYGDTYYVAFDLKYFVANGMESKQGTVLNEMNLTKINGEWKITLIRQTREKASATTAPQSTAMTNAPVTTIPAPASVPVTNQPSGIASASPNPFDQFDPKPSVTNQPPQVAPADNSIDVLRQKAEAGDAKSQFDLGGCYYNGTGIEKNDVEAANWWRKSADQGNAKAQAALGISCFYGIGVNKDLVEAVKWFRKSAEQGNATAQFFLGGCYCRGDGVKKDDVEGAAWYRKAADQGNADAQASLGACYDTGEGVDKDVVEAAKWYRKSAEQGNAIGQLLLGGSFVQGLGNIKNEIEGMAWMYVASANGNESAAHVISLNENTYSASIISAARQRATELQAQIASHTVQEPSSSTTSISQPTSAPNTPKESGSGAFISADGLVLTAAHVVQGASRIEVVTATGTFAAAVVKIDPTNDVALLKCTGNNFSSLPIALSKNAREGATVFTIGFPNIQLQGFDPKLTKGEISSETGFQDDPRQWQISVPTQPGNSGGPLCDENGNLIGIVEATLNPLTMAKVEGEIPQNVNYAVKSSYILPLLDNVQNLPPPLVPSSGTKFEDIVGNVQKSVVLILVY